jgi:hypothetical protein
MFTGILDQTTSANVFNNSTTYKLQSLFDLPNLIDLSKYFHCLPILAVQSHEKEEQTEEEKRRKKKRKRQQK